MQPGPHIRGHPPCSPFDLKGLTVWGRAGSGGEVAQRYGLVLRKAGL